MQFAQLGSPDPKYLAATDILIGDMSDTNYEFLLFDRPIVLLANDWLKKNMADIGIKISLDQLEIAIEKCITDPLEYALQRKEWLEKTIHEPFTNASERVLQIAITRSGYANPAIEVLHGDSEVRAANMRPLYEKAQELKLKCAFSAFPTLKDKELIFFAAHFGDLNVSRGFKVHLDHGLKGLGTANVEMSKKDYQKNSFFPNISLHITAGEMGDRRTKMLLGPNSGRTEIVGYPKADHLLACNTTQNRESVFRELGFNSKQLLVTYAPAGKYSEEKPGGSYSIKVVEELRRIAERKGFNLLIKFKAPPRSLYKKIIRRLRSIARI